MVFLSSIKTIQYMSSRKAMY